MVNPLLDKYLLSAFTHTSLLLKCLKIVSVGFVLVPYLNIIGSMYLVRNVHGLYILSQSVNIFDNSPVYYIMNIDQTI